MHKMEDPSAQKETENNIPYQFVSLIVHMSYVLQWITNSTSWELGELQDFDRDEIRLKLKNIHI